MKTVPETVSRLNLRNNFVINDTLKLANKGEHINVILLFGQSNAAGCSWNSCLSTTNQKAYQTLSHELENTFINYNVDNFMNHSDGFVPVKLGQGYDKEHYGPEVTIGEYFQKTSPNKTFIIKYAYGGTSLAAEWLDGSYHRGGLYQHSLEFTKQSLDYLISKGYILDIKGIAWMQGESDGDRGEYELYEESTFNLLSFYREDLQQYSPNIRFVDAYIHNIWRDYPEINKAKLNVKNRLPNIEIVDTLTLGLTTNLEPFEGPDIAHYDSLSMLKLGTAFGELLNK